MYFLKKEIKKEPMYSKHSLFGLTLLLITFFGCTSTQYKNKLKGTWVVEEFRLNGKELVGGELNLNMVEFKKDGECGLPMRVISSSDQCNWDIIKIGESYFLSIKEAKDTIFNNNFRIEFSTEQSGPGIVTVVKLSSPNLYWKCTK